MLKHTPINPLRIPFMLFLPVVLYAVFPHKYFNFSSVYCAWFLFMGWQFSIFTHKQWLVSILMLVECCGWRGNHSASGNAHWLYTLYFVYYFYLCIDERSCVCVDVEFRFSFKLAFLYGYYFSFSLSMICVCIGRIMPCRFFFKRSRLFVTYRQNDRDYFLEFGH